MLPQVLNCRSDLGLSFSLTYSPSVVEILNLSLCTFQGRNIHAALPQIQQFCATFCFVIFYSFLFALTLQTFEAINFKPLCELPSFQRLTSIARVFHTHFYVSKITQFGKYLTRITQTFHFSLFIQPQTVSFSDMFEGFNKSHKNIIEPVIVNGTVPYKICKQLFEYQPLLLL